VSAPHWLDTQQCGTDQHWQSR